MTKEEILKKCTWDDYGFGTLKIYSELFEKEINVDLFPESERQINEQMVLAINQFLNLRKTEIDNIKLLLWNDCKATFQETSYGFESDYKLLEGETIAQANHRDFNIHNKEDAFKTSKLKRVNIPDSKAKKLEHIYATLEFNVDWQDEYGCSIIIKNGNLIATNWDTLDLRNYEGSYFPKTAFD